MLRRALAGLQPMLRAKARFGYRLPLGALLVGAVLLVLAFGAPTASADGPTSLGTTPWQISYDPAIYSNPQPTVEIHGEPGEYAAAPAIPAVNAGTWVNCGPGVTRCPNASIIGMAVASILPGCWTGLNFTFFQSLVSIPTGTSITQFSVNMSGADDGARISVVNSAYPGGVTPPGGYIYQGTPQSTANLSSYVVAGEVNRVIITQVDDCATGNNLNSAQISLNGTVVPVQTPTTTTVSFGAGPFVYNGSAFTATAIVSPAGSGSATITYTGDCANVGSTCTATASYAGDTNHTPSSATASVTITPAPVTATAGGGSGAYNGVAQAPSACVVSGAYTGDLTCANTPATVGPNVGSTTIAPAVSGTGQANFTITPITGAYTITPATVTATAGSGTSVYNAATQTPSACLVAGAYTGDLVCANNPASVGPNVGTTTIAPVMSSPGGHLANFTVTLVTGSYSITKAPSTTVVSGGGSFNYDGTGHPLTALVTGVGGLNQALPVVGCVASPTLPADSCTGTASYPGDANHFGSGASATVTITIDYAYPAGGVFVVGNQTPHGLLSTVPFWGAQWAKQNSLSGGAAPSAFKGFENTAGVPSCGSTWTSAPGNSVGPPSSLPQYMAVVVTSNVTKSGSKISGNVTQVIIVKTNAGYGPNPGHAGTGTVLQVLCTAP